MDNHLAPTSDQKASGEAQSSHLLSREETREILTPFAFEIDKSLFGFPLASPYKRGFALLVDLLAIAILSGAPGELLAIVLAITFFRLGSRKRAQAMGKVKGSKRRVVARFIGAFIVFIMLVDFLPSMFNNDIFNGSSTESPGINGVLGSEDGIAIAPSELGLASTIILSKTVIELTQSMSESDCQDTDCWQRKITPTLTQQPFISVELTPEFAENAIKEIVDETELPQEQQTKLASYLINRYQEARAEVLTTSGNLSRGTKALEKDGIAQINSKISESKTPKNKEGYNEGKAYFNKVPPTDEQESTKSDKPIYSIMEYVKGIIEDLGLGFGWAAFYFTVLTSIWKGQTLGKKMFSIKVLQLDGTPLSLWDSFGRYGGYGAGIATGLLGFAQIFWDPNRQAIHDKISATVVVDAVSTTGMNYTNNDES
ncbi:RDD family protein [Thalassotalea atypica]|uniref:RDD family protein n=1 Tax=Thalassotalea atypica TaxID=2054316 RepID=UPI002572B98C|nr:RDD family protein [Thalassotalea atypica]